MPSKYFNDNALNRPKFAPKPQSTTTGAAPSTTDNKGPIKSIYLGCPVHDSRMHTCYAMNIWKIISQSNYAFAFAKTSMGGITKARNDLANRFLKGTWDYIWFTDSDLEIMPEHFEKLIAHDVDIIGGIYPHKRLDLQWSARGLIPDGKREHGRQEVAGVGMGCTLIKRKVFETMVEKMPQLKFRETWNDGRGEIKYAFFQEQLGIDAEAGATEPEWQTEDWFFFVNARKLGFKVHTDTTFHIKHHDGGQQFPVPQMEPITDTLIDYMNGLQDGGKKAKHIMETILPGYLASMEVK